MAVTFPLLKGVFESLFNCHGNLTFYGSMRGRLFKKEVRKWRNNAPLCGIRHSDLNPKKRGEGWAGGEEESRLKWTGETDLGGAQFIFCTRKATMY